MITLAIIFFIIAALLGMYLLSYVLQAKPTPKSIAFLHGAMAVTGVVILIFYTATHAPAPVTSLILFLLAALGGLTLIYRDLTGKSVPAWLALMHGSVALIAFITLIIFAIKLG